MLLVCFSFVSIYHIFAKGSTVSWGWVVFVAVYAMIYITFCVIAGHLYASGRLTKNGGDDKG